MNTNHMPSKFCIKLKTMKTNNFFATSSHSCTINLICSLVGSAYDVISRTESKFHEIPLNESEIIYIAASLMNLVDSVFWIPEYILR